jgi:putative phosphoesterase
MRIGVVSDTHNNLRNVRRIVELFNAARVERVIHTGDITQAKTLEIFAHLDAPLFGVYGNNDQDRWNSRDRCTMATTWSCTATPT